MRLDYRTMTRLVARQSLLPFLTPPEDTPEENLVREPTSVVALAHQQSGSASSGQFAANQAGRKPRVDWTKEWDVHVSLSTPVTFDCYHYGGIVFPQDVIGVLMHGSSRLSVEVLLSKAVLLQPITTRISERTGLIDGDTITSLLCELEATAAIATATATKHSGSSSLFSRVVHKAAAKISTLAGLTQQNLIVPEKPKEEHMFKTAIRRFHGSGAPGSVSPQVLLEWLVQPLKGMLETIPSIKEDKYRTTLLELMSVFTSTVAEENDASVGVIEYELHGYLLRYLRTCNVNHTSHDAPITEFTTFAAFYHHVSLKLLQTRYKHAKATDAIALFRDVVTLWAVSLMNGIRRHLRSRHFIFVTGAKGAGISATARVLRQLAEEDGADGAVVAEVHNKTALTIALDSAFDATVVFVCEDAIKPGDAPASTSDGVQGVTLASIEKIAGDIAPRVKSRRQQRCVVVKNKLDETMAEGIAQLKEVAAAVPPVPTADGSGTAEDAKWLAVLAHLTNERIGTAQALPLAYTATAPSPDHVATIADELEISSSDVLRKLSAMTFQELRVQVLTPPSVI